MEGNEPSQIYEKKALFKMYQIIWYVLGVVETILGFRLFLKLAGANAGSPFTSFIYNISYPLAAPFLGILRTPATPDGFVLESSTILAMMVYVVVAYGVVYFIKLIKPTSKEEIEETVKNI